MSDIIKSRLQTNTSLIVNQERKIHSVHSLPSELLERIFSFLSPKDLGQVSCVGRLWHSIADTNNVWFYPCKKAKFISVKYTDEGMEIKYQDKTYLVKEGDSPQNFNLKEIYKGKTKKKRAPKRKDRKRAQKRRNQNFKNSPLLRLPSEVLEYIFKYASPQTLINLSRTSALIAPLANANSVWIYPCEKERFILVKVEDNSLKIFFKGQQVYLRETKVQEESFQAKKLFQNKMQKRLLSVAHRILDPAKEILGEQDVEILKQKLLSGSLWDADNKEEEIYTILTTISEKVAGKQDVPVSQSQVSLEIGEKLIRFTLALSSRDPKIVTMVLKRDQSSELIKTSDLLEVTKQDVIQSNNLELFQILLDLGVTFTEKDLSFAIQQGSEEIAVKLIETGILPSNIHLQEATRALGGFDYFIFRLSFIDSREDLREFLRSLRDLTGAQKFAVEMSEFENMDLEDLQAALLEKKQRQLDFLAALCDRIEAKSDKISFSPREAAEFWCLILATKNLDLIKKSERIVERSDMGKMLQLALALSSIEVAMHYLEELEIAKQKGAPPLVFPGGEDARAESWSNALKKKDPELIKKMVTVCGLPEPFTIFPTSLLGLACRVSDTTMVAFLLEQGLAVTTEAFNEALKSGNKDLFDLLLKHQERFNPDKESGESAIIGNNIELVRDLLKTGYKFSLLDLLPLEAGQRGDQILELLQKEDRIIFDLGQYPPEAISYLRMSSARIKNLKLLQLLYDKKILGERSSLLRAKQATIGLRQKGTLKTRVKAARTMSRVTPYEKNILKDRFVHWMELRNNREKYSLEYDQAVEEIKFLLKQKTERDSCYKLLYTSFSIDFIQAAVDELGFSIPKNAYQWILTCVVEEIVVEKIDLLVEKDIESLYSTI